MASECKCAGYGRVATKAQAYPQAEKKLEAVRLLQEIGYKVAVAPVDFQGDSDSLKQIPPLWAWLLVILNWSKHLLHCVANRLW